MINKQLTTNNYHFFIFLFIWLLNVVFADAEALNYDTWLAPSPNEQFNIEAKDDYKGFGRIFVPVMTNKEWEPTIDIYKDNKLTHLAENMGESIFLEAGNYKIVFGSGITEEQKIVKYIEVKQECTEIIPVDWCGLIIRIIDESRNFLKKSYELFDTKTEDSYGIKISKDEDEIGEHPDTWILPPGLYKITTAGAPYNTFTNFTTVRLLPNTLTQYTIVIDGSSGDLIGAGILKEMEMKLVKKTHWSTYSALHSSVNITSENKSSKEKFDTDINLSTKFENRFRYETKKQFFLSEPSIELVLSKEEQAKLHISTDKLLLNNIYIYYFVPLIGLYGRFDVETKLFPGKIYYDSKQDSIIKISNDDTREVIYNKDEVSVSPTFFPLMLKEGLGLNFTPIRTNKLNFSIRAGLGLWQYIRKDVFERSSESDVIFKEINSSYIKGLEVSSSANFQPIHKLLWTLRVDMLFPYTGDKEPNYELKNVINYRLLKFLSLEYRFIYKKEATRDYAWIENNIWLRLSYTF